VILPGEHPGDEPGSHAEGQDGELRAEDVAKEFPQWHVWLGICHLWYARLLGASPAVVVRGENPVDLRDEIRRTVAGLSWPRY
jgi:hypothetical protein